MIHRCGARHEDHVASFQKFPRDHRNQSRFAGANANPAKHARHAHAIPRQGFAVHLKKPHGDLIHALQSPGNSHADLVFEGTPELRRAILGMKQLHHAFHYFRFLDAAQGADLPGRIHSRCGRWLPPRRGSFASEYPTRRRALWRVCRDGRLPRAAGDDRRSPIKVRSTHSNA